MSLARLILNIENFLTNLFISSRFYSPKIMTHMEPIDLMQYFYTDFINMSSLIKFDRYGIQTNKIHAIG